ncbi:dihydrofolate reductase family protein [Chloroflexota bacterium]
MKRIILYIAQSLDGYVAKKDGSVAWLDEFSNVPDVDYGYSELINSVDTVVQGNTTYQQFKDKHIEKNSYVFSHSVTSPADDGITFVKGSTRKFVDNLDENTHHNIWLVGGPNLLASFLNEGQVDELIIFIMPVLLRNGIPLFSNLEISSNILLQSTKTYENGVVELRYVIKK